MESTRPSIYFWISSASIFVRPFPLPTISAFAFPFSVLWSAYVPFTPNLSGFARDCIIITASDKLTSPSQFASPASLFSSGCEEVVTVVSVLVVDSIVVVSVVVVSDVVDVITVLIVVVAVVIVTAGSNMNF